jgi:hypothetical protein
MVVALLTVCACRSQNPTAASPSTSPRTVFVSGAGSDRNEGTSAAPWLTLRYAVAQLRAGDTLYIRGGIYSGAENVIDSEVNVVPSGTSWSDVITIAGYFSEVVTLQPPDGQQAIRLTASGPHYLVFQDFIVDMVRQSVQASQGGPDGIYLSGGANHNRFQRLEIKNNQGNGIMFSDNNGNSPFNEVLNCSIHDNGQYPGTNTGYGAYVFTTDNLFEGNDVYNNGGYGLHFFSEKSSSSVSRNTIQKNRIHDNGTHGGTNYGIVVASGDANVIQDNNIYFNRGGVQVYTRSSNASVNNNTIYNNTPLEGVLVLDATGTVVKDNIVYANGVNIVDQGSGTTLSNNHGP